VAVRARLEKEGFEVISFHCNGIGAQAMEELVAEGRIAGVIDLSPKDIPDLLHGGIFPAYAHRMEPPIARGVPYLLVPGTMDFILLGPAGSLPESIQARAYVRHNPLHTHVRATRDEMIESGRFVARRLADGHGPRLLLVPTKGFSELNASGRPLYDPEADAGFIEGVERELLSHPDHGIEIEKVPLHINDPRFAAIVAERMITVMSGNR